MPVEAKILGYLASIEKSLSDLDRKMDECLVMANRVDWNIKYYLNGYKTRT